MSGIERRADGTVTKTGAQELVRLSHLNRRYVINGKIAKAKHFQHGEGPHGGQLSAEYRVWRNMRNRCSNPKVDSYEYYGGRGITVCERWSSYVNFLADMGRRPSPAHSIDRINNDGNYEPGNCRWATLGVQRRNRRNIKLYRFQGQEITLTEISALCGIKVSTLWARLKRGYSLERAASQPLRGSP